MIVIHNLIFIRYGEHQDLTHESKTDLLICFTINNRKKYTMQQSYVVVKFSDAHILLIAAYEKHRELQLC